ncbi:uncharacterized protein N7515_008883 [Penicillium bovifimosum]|uniref:Uncharacterized protein n=1 Tax=Penicillium bovifimosum TaxID=126998 RepID=A0A9W9GNT9_9EURO|nr:uncharacterized protein N7515_008883 [Penicillium bovifimosum]KAJ5125058.1 hypothetical protein N7515_008883 [Penicillium bovifimosum]
MEGIGVSVGVWVGTTVREYSPDMNFCGESGVRVDAPSASTFAAFIANPAAATSAGASAAPASTVSPPEPSWQPMAIVAAQAPQIVATYEGRLNPADASNPDDQRHFFRRGQVRFELA